ncbi:MAG: hypothetical protein OXP75_07050 [Rhodospirillales bacterium]|nr:hypothetical protein [Rhodospirillales bacterium]
MPKPHDNRLSIFPDREAAAEAAEKCRTERFTKVVPDTVAGGLNVVRRDTYRGRSVSSTWLCEDGRFRFLDTCDW